MSMNWSAIGSSASGLLGSIFGRNDWQDSANLNFEMNKALQDRQFEYNKWFVQHGHQNEVSDLRAAGLNPILSANNGAYSQVGIPSVGSFDKGQSRANAINSALAIKNMDNQTKLANSDVALKASAAGLNNAQTGLSIMKQKTEFLEQNIKSLQAIEQDITNKIRQKDYDSYDVRLLNDTRDSLSRQQQALASITSSSAQSMEARTNRMQYEFQTDYAQDVSKRYASWGKNHPYLRNIDETVQRWLGPAAVAGAGVAYGVNKFKPKRKVGF